MAYYEIKPRFYFLLKEGCQFDFTVKHNVCSNTDCKESRKPTLQDIGKFCSECGSPIETREIVDGKRFPMCWETCEEIFENGEPVYPQEGVENIWIYNYQTTLFSDDDFYEEGKHVNDYLIPFSGFNWEDVVRRIENNEDPKLLDTYTKLKEKFGDNIELKFGVFMSD